MSNLKSKKGHFLVANSTLQDPNFTATVVLLIEHDDSGAFGLIVNRVSEIHLSAAIENLSMKAQSVPLFEGGPVRTDALFILHSEKQLAKPGDRVVDGVFMSSEKAQLEKLLETESNFHVYHGYSGWAPGQLEAEIEAKSWVIVPAKAEIIFHENPENAWREALAHQGGLFEYFAQNVRDPFLN